MHVLETGHFNTTILWPDETKITPSTEPSGLYAWTRTLAGVYYGHERLGGDFIRQIAIPRTLSTAENRVCCGFVSHVFCTTNLLRRKLVDDIPTRRGRKTALSSQYLAPSGIIFDAEPTFAASEKLWSVNSCVREGLSHY